ncbi:hypothetical protein PMIN03_008003 [Paraphaeosphaeria minitans]
MEEAPATGLSARRFTRSTKSLHAANSIASRRNMARAVAHDGICTKLEMWSCGCTSRGCQSRRIRAFGWLRAGVQMQGPVDADAAAVLPCCSAAVPVVKPFVRQAVCWWCGQ